MRVMLSAGHFGGHEVEWSVVAGVKIVSVQYEEIYWNYDITINPDDSLRADFIGCTLLPVGEIVQIIV